MFNPMPLAPFYRATIPVGLPPSPERHDCGPQGTEDAPVHEEEPEIVRLFVAHYRTLLRLRHLTQAQRMRITGLLALCEARMPARADDRSAAASRASGDPPPASHQALECLTAIRLYAIGAQRALASGRPDPAAYALAAIITQVDRAHALLAASRPQAEGTAPGYPTPTIAPGMNRS